MEGPPALVQELLLLASSQRWVARSSTWWFMGNFLPMMTAISREEGAGWENCCRSNRLSVQEALGGSLTIFRSLLQVACLERRECCSKPFPDVHRALSEAQPVSAGEHPCQGREWLYPSPLSIIPRTTALVPRAFDAI